MVSNTLNKVALMIAVFAVVSFILTGCGGSGEAASSSGLSSTESAGSEAVVVEVPPMSTNGILYGIVINSTEKSVTLQTDAGRTVKLGLDENADVSEIKDGIVSGAALRLEYEGSIKGTSVKGVKVTKITESDKLPKLSKEALAKAGEIILAVSSKDISTLARLCDYPVTLGGDGSKRITSVQDFISLNRSEIFTKRLVSSVSGTNLFITAAYDDGFLLGISEPNIVVQNTKDGYQITGFRY